jgi:hypothetical protein
VRSVLLRGGMKNKALDREKPSKFAHFLKEGLISIDEHLKTQKDIIGR